MPCWLQTDPARDAHPWACFNLDRAKENPSVLSAAVLAVPHGLPSRSSSFSHVIQANSVYPLVRDDAGRPCLETMPLISDYGFLLIAASATMSLCADQDMTAASVRRSDGSKSHLLANRSRVRGLQVKTKCYHQNGSHLCQISGGSGLT